MISHIEEIRKAGNTVGGNISCVVKGVPIGLGEPVLTNYKQILEKQC